MSALRLGRLPDGTREVRILEPAVGRVTFSRLGIRGGGEYVVAKGPTVERTHKRPPEEKPQARDDLAGIPRPTCGLWMPNAKAPCGRTPGHRHECKTRAALEVAADIRRATRFVDLNLMSDLDNGGVKPTTTEVQR